MRILLSLILVILLIIFSIYLAVLNPDPISLTLPLIGHFKDVPTIVVILSSILLGVGIAFVVMLAKETSRGLSSWRKTRRQKDSDAIDQLYNDGLNLMSAGRRADAIVNFNKVISRDPQFVYAYVSLGDIYFSEANYDKASEYLSRAHQLKDDSIDILIKQEKSFEAARRPAEEVAVLKKVIELDNTNLYAFVKMRHLYIQLGNWEEAHDIQKQILSLTKTGAQKKAEQQCMVGILYEVAGAAREAGDFDEAVKQYREIIKHNKDFVPAYIKLSETYQEDTEEAIRVLVKANKQSPSYLYFPHLEELYLKRENPSAIIDAYKSAIQRSPDEVRLNFLLGKLYLKLEMLDEAMGQFMEVLAKDSDSPSVHFMIAEVHERFRRWQEASVEYKKSSFAPGEENAVFYTCPTCNNKLADWADRCQQCNNWNTFQMKLT